MTDTLAPIVERPATLAQLKTAWAALLSSNPKLRIRNVANALKVSELELLMTRLGDGVSRLRNDHGALLTDLQALGPVMALTRNDQVVHEKTGVYTDFKITAKGAMGLCLGDIDLRVFFSHWQHALQVEEKGPDGPRVSIQFFDGAGGALHKVYQTEQTDRAAWQALVALYQDEVQSAALTLKPVPAQEYPNHGKAKPSDIRAEWEALQDVHHFHAMLNRLGIGRKEALQKVGADFALPVPVITAEKALRLALERRVPIMAFVGNRGLVQIHTGPIHKLLRTGPWFNVLDEGFNLHFNTEETTEVWIVRRPSSDGVITSLEVYNAADDLILTLFGERKPGIPERADWQQLVQDLETEQAR